MSHTGHPIITTYAERIYDILVEHCSAHNDAREKQSFVHAQVEGCIEWRFQGALGFGGKFWNNAGRWYVNGYPEEMTPERETIVQKANAQLITLQNDYAREVEQ